MNLVYHPHTPHTTHSTRPPSTHRLKHIPTFSPIHTLFGVPFTKQQLIITIYLYILSNYYFYILIITFKKFSNVIMFNLISSYKIKIIKIYNI